MEKKNKKQEQKSFYIKVSIFFVLLFLAWFNLSRADLGEYNIFQDKDQDGISDSEEISYGTDPEKKDSDGDGYSDKVEIESGYDPLKPAPGDRIIPEETRVLGENNKSDNEKSNLTEEFFKEIGNQEVGEAAILNELLTTGDVTEEELKELYSEEGKGGVDEILHELSKKESVNKGEVEISDDDIKILPKPEGEEDEVREKEKEQIERYVSSLLYIMAVNRPFELEDIDTLPDKISQYITQLNGSVQSGNIKEVQEFKKTTKEIFEQVKKLEAPYVLSEQHLSILNIYQVFHNEIDENKLLSDDDPLATLLYFGKIESIFFELEKTQQQINAIAESYGIETFNLSSIEESL